MKKKIRELQEIFDKEYLKDCTSWQALRMNNIIGDLICIEEEIRSTKNVI